MVVQISQYKVEAKLARFREEFDLIYLMILSGRLRVSKFGF